MSHRPPRKFQFSTRQGIVGHSSACLSAFIFGWSTNICEVIHPSPSESLLNFFIIVPMCAVHCTDCTRVPTNPTISRLFSCLNCAINISADNVTEGASQSNQTTQEQSCKILSFSRFELHHYSGSCSPPLLSSVQ